MAQRFGGLFPSRVRAIPSSHWLLLDRLRQFTEHNLMPLENKDGSRSFGFGFWAF